MSNPNSKSNKKYDRSNELNFILTPQNKLKITKVVDDIGLFNSKADFLNSLIRDYKIPEDILSEYTKQNQLFIQSLFESKSYNELIALYKSAQQKQHLTGSMYRLLESVIHAKKELDALDNPDYIHNNYP